MTVIFQNFILWPLLALAATPLLLHLLAKFKPKTHPFSCNDFLLKIVRSNVRFKRPGDLLLLLVRTLLFAAVATLFLLPILLCDGGILAKDGTRRVVFVIDASASMAYQEDGQSRFAAAKAEASRALSDLDPGDEANIVWIRRRPLSVFPVMGVNLEHLRSELRRAAVTNEAANVEAALALAAESLENAEGAREICVISDFQATNWEGITPRIPDGARTIMMKVGRRQAENQAVGDILVPGGPGLPNTPTLVSAEIKNFSPLARKRSVFLKAGERRGVRAVTLPPWGSTTTTFSITPKTGGEIEVNFTLEEDDFPADNARRALVAVDESLKMAVIGDGDNARYWEKALKTLPWVSVEHFENAPLPRKHSHGVVFVDDWSGGHAQTARAALEDGALVVFAPGPETAAADIRTLLAGEESTSASVWEDGAEFTLVTAKPDDPVFAIFKSGEYGDPAAGTFRFRLRLPSDAVTDDDVLLRYQDGVPALARRSNDDGGGPILWNLQLRDQDGNWAGDPLFVPILGEMLLNGRRGIRGAKEPELFPGGTPTLEVDERITVADVFLESPDGERIRPGLKLVNGEPVLVCPPVEALGVHVWMNGEHPIKSVAVNFPDVESDLRPLDDEAIETIGDVQARSADAIKTMRAGVDLWPFLLAAAVVLALIEGLLMWRFER